MLSNFGLFRVPWTARRANQSILKKINPEYSLEELMLRQEPTHWRKLMLGKIEGKRRGGNR